MTARRLGEGAIVAFVLLPFLAIIAVQALGFVVLLVDSVLLLAQHPAVALALLVAGLLAWGGVTWWKGRPR